MKIIKVGILGPGGRMGREIIKQSESYKQILISCLCERKNHKFVGKKISGITVDDAITNLINVSEVIIDFSVPSATLKLMKEIDKSQKKVAVVTGTTGYTKKEEKTFTALANGKTVLQSYNMSIGIGLLKNLVSYSSEKIGNLSDIEIVETHHNQKRDIPSGTAISLAESITEGNKQISKMAYREKNNDKIRKKNEIGFASIRGGDVIGEHSVNFYLDGERVELKHIASDRKIFSRGAIEAAMWVSKKKPGLYTIMDMLKN